MNKAMADMEKYQDQGEEQNQQELQSNTRTTTTLLLKLVPVLVLTLPNCDYILDRYINVQASTSI